MIEDPAAAEVKHGDRGHLGLDILDGVMVEVKAATARGIHAPEIDVFHRRVMHDQVIIAASEMIRNDAIARIEICATHYRTAR